MQWRSMAYRAVEMAFTYGKADNVREKVTCRMRAAGWLDSFAENKLDGWYGTFGWRCNPIASGRRGCRRNVANRWLVSCRNAETWTIPTHTAQKLSIFWVFGQNTWKLADLWRHQMKECSKNSNFECSWSWPSLSSLKSKWRSRRVNIPLSPFVYIILTLI